VPDTRAAILKRHMLATHQMVGDRSRWQKFFDTDSWWRDPTVVAAIGAALADPFRETRATLVVSPASSGIVLGSLVARELGIGFAVIKKEEGSVVDSDTWISATTPPDYRDRHLTMTIRKRMLRPADRVLAVDDVADTGGQLTAIKRLVEIAEAEWIGASVAVDTIELQATRRALGLRSLINGREID